MKKNKFIHSTIILIIGGFLTKLLGMLVKIILTRKIGLEGVGLYSLILPTYLLLISISGLGLPTALNVLISSNKYNNKNLLIYSIFIGISLDILIIIFLFIMGYSITNNLLHDTRLYYPLLCIGFTLPFISISNIFRSYYLAQERMYPHVISNVLEDLIKLICIILFINFFLNSMEATLSFIISINILSELSSIIIFLTLLPKFRITKKDLKFNLSNIKAIMKISIPTTISRLIGSITYFLEPIILSYVLLKLGFSNQYILEEYGIINGYAIALITLPSFFTNAISQALIPIVSNNYQKKRYKYIKNKLSQAIIISLLIGITSTIIFICFGETLLKFLYNTTQGYNYIKILAPIFILFYIESPILSTLQAMNRADINMKISLINMLIRTIGLFIFAYLNIGMYSLVIALSLNIVFSAIYGYYKVEKLINH